VIAVYNLFWNYSQYTQYTTYIITHTQFTNNIGRTRMKGYMK